MPNSSWEFPSDFAGGAQFLAFKQGLLDLYKPTAVDGRSFDGFWNASGRFEQYNASQSDYFAEVYSDLITYYQWNNFGAPWFEDFAVANDGRTPFVNPSPRVRWAYGQVNVTETEFNSSLAKRAVFEDFIDTAVLVPDQKTCSKSIYVVPLGRGAANYIVKRL